MTLGDALREYQANGLKGKPSNAAKDRNRIDQILADSIASRSLVSLKTTDIARYRDKLKQDFWEKQIRAKRRAKAVERILHGNTPIQNLVSYFDPLSNAKPTKIAEPAIGGALDAYGLNADQIAAFDKLWTNGPVGLLQGPPGTGKTYFIAAFIHYALTKGGCRNVLLVSQSHEAVNTAAERIQTKMRDTQQDLDMLRVSNDPEKISDSLRRSHVDAIQDLYLARFEAEAKDRLCMVAKRLGLPRDFAADFFEAHAGPIEMSRQIASLQSMRTSAEDAELLSVRVESLKEALEAQLRRFEIDAVEVLSNPTVIAEAVESAIIEKYDVRDFDAIRRLRDVQGTADQ
jgi:DNA replication protein DnaC